MHLVYSTLTNNNIYAQYDYSGPDLPRVVKSVLINGGTGVADKNIVTPIGVVTQVTDEDMRFLETEITFKEHVKNGFIKVEKTKRDMSKVTKDMILEDKSAPLTPNSKIFKETGLAERPVSPRN